MNGNEISADMETRQKVAIYIRVSTAYQVDKDSLPMQRKDLTAYSELILGISDYVIFEDAGYSGKNTDRPAFQEMMSRIKQREFSHLLVWKIDRISRNLLDFSEMYSELKRLKVVFVSKNEKFDTSTAMGEAMLKIILVFAELERNMTAERVTATMISRANQGQWNGGRVPFGYDYKDGVFTIREDEAIVCRMIADDYIKNKSLIHTARLVCSNGYKTRAGMDFSARAVWFILSSPFYAGIYRYNRYKGTEHRTINDESEWVMVENHHPAIFTMEQYEKIHAILENNKRYNNTSDQKHMTKNVYVFGQICYCAKCGVKMTSTSGRVQADGYKTSIYHCPTRRTKGCSNSSVNDLIIGEFVINYVSNIINAKKTFSTIISPEALQSVLLRGQTFKQVQNIDKTGLNALFDILGRFKGDASFVMTSNNRRKRVKFDSEIVALKKDKERHERALKRLNDLFLYSDKPMSEKDYITQKAEITERIDEIIRKLGIKTASEDEMLSDDDFIRKASHLLISSRLQDKQYIYYKNLARDVSPDILKEYINSIIDNIHLNDGHVSSITFKNGITHEFEYKKEG